MILWGAALVWLSLTPSPPAMPAGLLSWDKFQHAAAYGMLTLLAGWAFAQFIGDVRRRWRRAVAVSVAIGLLLEVAQGVFTTYRTAEVGDLLADCIGAAAVYLIVMRVNRGRGKNGWL